MKSNDTCQELEQKAEGLEVEKQKPDLPQLREGLPTFAGGRNIRDYLRSRITISETSSCVEWNRGKDWDGYGVAFDGVKRWRVHRLAYVLFVGDIPEGLNVLHHCDNPACVNPDHLFLGTAHDNMQDAIKKGRHRGPKGEEQGQSKLTNAAVCDIMLNYRWRKPGFNMYDFARKYNVTASAVWDVLHGNHWTHVLINVPM